ncbi:DUF445 domain-containing protein [Aerophototrophica crusticola]|uniref:DUF445 domain-containing protein n=1 Tax=Aerophototrophica crusticola TaxID=1709002 RepID=A0A858R314_9PROT|nr:DUF445 domain-containing protein [Rhodospirillaceae bacterium B3]
MPDTQTDLRALTTPSPLPPAGPDFPDEAAEVADLRRHKLMAGGCLALAALGWGASHTGVLPPGAAAPLRAVAEAGMVGGLADWFAVTALFRRPLGLPIPHTALVPRNRDRIADGIAAYIDREFLAPTMLVEQLRRMDLAARLSGLLAGETSRDRVADLVVGMLPALLREEREAAIRGTLTRALRRGLAGVDLRFAIARVLRAVVESEALEGLIGELTERAMLMVEDRRAWLQDAVAERSRWWIPKAVDRRVAGNMADAAIGHLFDLRSPHSEVGRDLRRWLAELPDEIEQGSPLGEKLTSIVNAALSESSFAQLVGNAVGTLREMALEDLAKPDGRIREVVAAALGSLAEQLDDADLRARINSSIEEAFVAAIPRWRQNIQAFVSGTLRAQDVEDFTRRLELRVGRDLQYIRINGTLLGAVIGGVLYVLNQALGG